VPTHAYPLLALGLATAALVTYLLRRRHKTPEEVERERRALISKIGRITDGTVIDINEMENIGSTKLIVA